MIKHLIRIEYGIAFLLVLFIYLYLGFSFWLFLILLFVPDVTMFGYVINEKMGSIIYNFGHSFIIPVVLLTISIGFTIEPLLISSCIWGAHILLDRCLGFGLKYEHSFKETHLQRF